MKHVVVDEFGSPVARKSLSDTQTPTVTTFVELGASYPREIRGECTLLQEVRFPKDKARGQKMYRLLFECQGIQGMAF